ncbi:hypothetical protein [Leeuwenhoekiella nanhaiensis]|uniref:Uncharacterized protein n=1 Tax=Leeuwenhoekiella nanhaiensis TaxID=1655491 RepID=A0A2G1VWG6_9FLAO|nr:hypothetical protein [Leeuwenhoekiella nanhaiensis]PHQ31122.1 hypothetical protein CJ305_02570 [Leeuwenhoekiella nanhaiensis]
MGILAQVMKEYFNTQTPEQIKSDWEAVSNVEIEGPSYAEFFETICEYGMTAPPSSEQNFITTNLLNPKFLSDFFMNTTYGKGIVFYC